MSCLFCRIVAKEIPVTVIYEDDETFAFLDNQPVNPGHTLVLPKKHTEDLCTCEPEVFASLSRAAQRIACAMKKSLQLEGINLIQNTGVAAGQSIFHLHLHLIPRHAGDGLAPWRGTPYATADEATSLAQKIREEL